MDIPRNLAASLAFKNSSVVFTYCNIIHKEYDSCKENKRKRGSNYLFDFFETYNEMASYCMDAPRSFHEFVSYSIVGTYLKNRLYLELGPRKIYPNLYTLIIAPSSWYRKSTSIELGKKFINQLCPETILPDEYSHERLIEILCKNPQGCLFVDELSTMMGNLSKDYMAGTKSLITSLYDCPPRYKRVLRKEEFTIENPVLSILAATTAEWMAGIKESDLKGGFLARFIFAQGGDKKESDPFPPSLTEQDISSLCNKFMDNKLESTPQPILFPPEAKDLYVKWYRDYESKYQSSQFSAFYTRLTITFLKLCMIVEFGTSQYRIIRKETVERVIDIVARLSEKLEWLLNEEMTFNPGQENAKRVLRLLERKGGKLTRSDLMISTRLQSREMTSVLEMLEEQNKITVHVNGKSKPTTTVLLVK